MFHELIIQTDLCYAKLCHYRDKQEREIDFIVESDDGKIACIEVKAGSVVSKSDFKHMRWFKQTLDPTHSAKTIILYTGDRILFFGDDEIALPISTLWID